MSELPAFQQLRIGDAIPDLVKGPLSEVHLMRWSAAMENWHRIHFDADYAREREKLPGLLIHGTLKQQFLAQAATRWAGPQGWLGKLGFRFRQMNFAGETLTVWGRIAGLRRQDDIGLVDLEMGIRNQDGIESTPAHATVALPVGGGRLPDPFIVEDSRSGAVESEAG